LSHTIGRIKYAECNVIIRKSIISWYDKFALWILGVVLWMLHFVYYWIGIKYLETRNNKFMGISSMLIGILSGISSYFIIFMHSILFIFVIIPYVRYILLFFLILPMYSTIYQIRQGSSAQEENKIKRKYKKSDKRELIVIACYAIIVFIGHGMSLTMALIFLAFVTHLQYIDISCGRDKREKIIVAQPAVAADPCQKHTGTGSSPPLHDRAGSKGNPNLRISREQYPASFARRFEDQK
jgi:hypothetical protein